MRTLALRPIPRWWMAVAVVACCFAPRTGAAAPDRLRDMVVPGTPQGFAAVFKMDARWVDPARYFVEIIRQYHIYSGVRAATTSEPLLAEQFRGVERLRNGWFKARGRDNTISIVDKDAIKRARPFLRLLGLEVVKEGKNPPRVILNESRYGEEARRQVVAAGLDIAGIADLLNRGQKLTGVLHQFTVPLPLPSTTWMKYILPRAVPNENLYAGILIDHNASMMYVGLLSMDAETRGYLGDNPRLLRDITKSQANTFAAIARSLRIRGGRVEVPGHDTVPGAVRLWEAWVGAPVTDPAQFLDRLLGDPKRAYVYDIYARLDTRALQFAFGCAPGNGPATPAVFRAVADRAAVVDPTYSIEEAPFLRPYADLFVLLDGVRFTDTGALAGPGDAVEWMRFFSARPVAAQPGPPLNAGTLAEVVLVPDEETRAARMGLFFFAQRVFPVGASGRLASLRDYLRFPLVFQVLERAGIRRPSTFQATATAAANLGTTFDNEDTPVALTQFQAAFSIVERAARTKALPSDRAADLLEGLSSLPLDRGRYKGQVANWVSKALIPSLALPQAPTPASGAWREAIILRALAGMPATGKPPVQVFEWEGASYEYDPATAEFKRLQRMREKQGGNNLDAVLDLAAFLERVPAITDAPGESAQLLKLTERLTEPPVRPDEKAIGIKPQVTDLASRAQSVARNPRDLPAWRQRVKVALEPIVDALVAHTLRSILYAAYLGDPDGELLMNGDLAHRHNLRLLVSGSPDARQAPAWTVPEEVPGGGSNRHVRGSLLALDLAMWKMALTAPSNEPPQGVHPLVEPNPKNFGWSGVLFDPYSAEAGQPGKVAEALRAGRQRVQQAMGDAAALEALAREAGLPEWAQNTIAWTLETKRESAVTLFGPRNLLTLGLGQVTGLSQATLDAWGASEIPVTGCLLLRQPSRLPPDDYQGRPRAGFLSSRSSDMTLRVAEWLVATKLPPQMARDILPVAYQDLRDAGPVAHWEDAHSVRNYIVGYPEQRFQQVVGDAVAAGAYRLADAAPLRQ